MHGTAVVHPAGSPQARSVLEALGSQLPPKPRATAAVVQICPAGSFVTYGLRIPLVKMLDPAAARARVQASNSAPLSLSFACGARDNGEFLKAARDQPSASASTRQGGHSANAGAQL